VACHTGEEAFSSSFQICLVLPVLPESEKATRELLKPGGLSGELPAGTPVPFTL